MLLVFEGKFLFLAFAAARFALAQPVNGGYRVADDVLAAADMLTDTSDEGVLYAAFWPNAEKTPSFDRAGGRWNGTYFDWLPQYNISADLVSPKGRFFKHFDPKNSSTTPQELTSTNSLLRFQVSVYPKIGFGMGNVVLFPPPGTEAERHISYADNASYTLQYSFRFVYFDRTAHAYGGLMHSAMVAVEGGPVWDASLGTFAAKPRALVGSYTTGLPAENDTHFDLRTYADLIDFREDSAVVGYELGSTFFCRTRRCCDKEIQKFDSFGDPWWLQNPGNSVPTPEEKCDWRLRSFDNNDSGLWVNNDSKPFPEHNKVLKTESTAYISDIYTVTITLLPPGYIANVTLPMRAYNFSFSGPRGGTSRSHTFVGLPPTETGLGLGVSVQGLAAHIRNMTVRKTRTMETLRALATKTTTAPPPPPTQDTVTTSADEPTETMTISVQNTKAPPETTTTTPTTTFPHDSTDKDESRDIVGGAFFLTAAVFLAAACFCACVSATRTHRAKRLLADERKKMLDDDAVAAAAAPATTTAKRPKRRDSKSVHSVLRGGGNASGGGGGGAGNDIALQSMTMLRKEKEK